MILLHTERLTFRTHELSDETAFVEMHTDPEVRRFVGGRAWSTDEAITRFRAHYLGEPRLTFGLWAAVLRTDGTYVGMSGLRGPSDRTAHLSYYIARRFWALGLASEAASAFVDFGFGPLGLRRILAEADKGNSISHHILEKLGFKTDHDETLASGRIIRHYELDH